MVGPLSQLPVQQVGSRVKRPSKVVWPGDIEFLLNRSLNALITGDVADHAVTVADHMAAYRLTEDLAVERGYAFYVTRRNTQHFCDP